MERRAPTTLNAIVMVSVVYTLSKCRWTCGLRWEKSKRAFDVLIEVVEGCVSRDCVNCAKYSMMMILIVVGVFLLSLSFLHDVKQRGRHFLFSAGSGGKQTELKIDRKSSTCPPEIFE